MGKEMIEPVTIDSCQKDLSDCLSDALSQMAYNLFGYKNLRRKMQALARDIVCYFQDPDEHADTPRNIGFKIAELHFIQPDLMGLVQKIIYESVLEQLSESERPRYYPHYVTFISAYSNAYTEHIIKFILKQQDETREKYIKQFEESQLQFKELYENLERLVERRTEDLNNVNQQLYKTLAEKEKSEQELKASEERYRTLSESSHDLIMVFDADSTIEYVNTYAAFMLNRDSDELLFSNLENWLTFQDDSDFYSAIKDVIEHNKPRHLQKYARVSTGAQIFLDIHMVPIVNADGKRVVLTISRDLTEQNVSKQQLADREQKYHTLFDTMQDAILLIDNDRIRECNLAGQTIFGFDERKLVDRNIWELGGSIHGYRNLRAAFQLFFKNCYNGENGNFEWIYNHPSGETVYLDVKITAFPEKEHFQILMLLRDITDEKKAHQALQASESRFRDIVERSLDGYYFMDLNYRFTKLNAAARRILGYSKLEVNNLFAGVLQSEKPNAIIKLAKKAMSGTPIVYQEVDFSDKNGSKKWVVINARRVYEGGRVIGVEGFIKNITPNKTAEEELRRSEARHRALFESTPYDVFGISLSQRFIRINQNFKDRWGAYDDKHVKNLQPPELANLLCEMCDEIQYSGTSVEQNFDLTVDGEKRYYRIIMVPIITAKHEMIGFAGMIIDVTDSVNVLAAKQEFAGKLVKTTEDIQKRIAKEIHDSLGQVLFALQLDISAVRSAIQKSPQEAETILTSAEKTLILAIKEASDMTYRLRPRLLDDFGLVAALEDLLENTTGHRQIEMNFNPIYPNPLNKDTETALFRITQEAVSNVLRHANASKLDVSLRQKTGICELIVQDDGVGFSPDNTEKRKRGGFGMLNMKERIELAGGRLEIISGEQTGTTIKAIIPMEEN